MGALSRPRGLTTGQLVRVLGKSRATLYRDLDTLRDAGVLVDVEIVNGESRRRLSRTQSSHDELSTSQREALRVARTALASLEGSSIVAHLDAWLRNAPSPIRSLVAARPAARACDPEVVRTVERALDRRRRVRFDYRGAKDTVAHPRAADPLALRLVGDQLYFAAHDVDKDELRTFKLARMSNALITRKRATPRRHDLDALFAHAVRAWQGDLVDVEIEIAPSAARFAREWPLHPDQRIETRPNGAARVRARVAGLEETTRWILSWGKQAKAIAPRKLVTAVRDELTAAAAQYGRTVSQRSRDGLSDGPGVARLRSGKGRRAPNNQVRQS